MVFINSVGCVRMVMNCKKSSHFLLQVIQYLLCICNLFNDAVNSSDHIVTSKALLRHFP
jgi:hypothetical protein